MHKKIVINHLAKTEGHSSFEGYLYDGKLKEARYLSEEGARLIEGILVGRYFEDAPIITSRICGVCPVVHNVASIKALESALGVKVHKNVETLRTLMMMGEFIGSHLLHSFFFSLPDLLDYPNDLDMMKKFPAETKAAFKIRTFSADLINLTGGRAVHPIANQVGGFKVWPQPEQIDKAIADYEDALAAVRLLIPIFKKIKYPVLERETEYISLGNRWNAYSIYDGDIVSNKGLKVRAETFNKNVEEVQRQREVIKHTSFRDMAYMLGALSRINNNGANLHREARKLWRALCPKKVTINPFMNIYAQVVELLDCVLTSGVLLRSLRYAKPIPPLPVEVRDGVGVGAVEAPRGTLLHYYQLDSKGVIKECNIMTPTAQFVSNIEEDIVADGPTLLKLGDKERAHRIKTLIRAYDPCISCATH